MRADGPPFILATEIMRVQRRICIPCKEIDRDTEGLERTIAQKFRNYHEFMQRKIYASHFGFDNALIPFITTDESRMRGMMNLLGPCPYIIFKVVPRLRARPALSRCLRRRQSRKRRKTSSSTKNSCNAASPPISSRSRGSAMGYPDFSLVDMRPV